MVSFITIKMTDLNSREFILKGEASGLKLVKKIQPPILSLGSCDARVNPAVC